MNELLVEPIWNRATHTERVWLLGPVTATVSGKEGRAVVDQLARLKWKSLPEQRRKELLSSAYFESGLRTILDRELRKE